MSPERVPFELDVPGVPEVARAQDAHALPARPHILRAQGYRRMRWKNDAGWTSEILRVPDQDAWDWRLSIAEVEADSAFSAFPGVDRWLMLLSGEGMQLCFQDGVTQTLRPPHGAAQFSGDRALTGRLVSGPSSDFNVMWRRDRMAAQTWHRPLVGSMVVFAEPGETWAIHLLAGQARFAKEHGLESGLNGELDDALDGELDGLQPGDTAVLQAAEIRQRYALDGAGELLLIRMTRLGSGPQA